MHESIGQHVAVWHFVGRVPPLRPISQDDVNMVIRYVFCIFADHVAHTVS